MINAINVPSQTINVNQVALFSNNRIKTNCIIQHDEGSGIFTINEQGLYNVFFQCNVTAQAATEISSLAIKVNDEPVQSAVATNTLTATGDVASVNLFVPINVNCCSRCCTTVSVENVGAAAVSITNASITLERIC